MVPLNVIMPLRLITLNSDYTKQFSLYNTFFSDSNFVEKTTKLLSSFRYITTSEIGDTFNLSTSFLTFIGVTSCRRQNDVKTFQPSPSDRTESNHFLRVRVETSSPRHSEESECHPEPRS